MLTPMLLDVDTGIDDAIAIALATTLPDHALVAVTTVAGNVPLDVATTNSLRVLSWIDAEVPVYRGMSRPLVRPLHTATRFHGNDGLGGWEAPASGRMPADETAPQAILRLAREHKGELEGVFVGPLTNLAVALALEPDLVGWFRHVTIMGGAFYRPGNETEHAEFNIFVDPEAANQVARSGIPATWIGLDVTHQTYLANDEWNALDAATSVNAQLVREVTRFSFETRGRQQAFLHDPLAVAAAAFPELVTVTSGQVLVETGHAASGETRLSPGESNTGVATAVDVDGFRRLFLDRLGLLT